MNTSVNIGSSQDFRLSRALLVYGTSSYQGFPYRYPFVTLHEVIHDDKGARLAAGQLMTVQMLADLMIGLGRSVPVEILPGCLPGLLVSERRYRSQSSSSARHRRPRRLGCSSL